MSGPNSYLPSEKTTVEGVHASQQARKRRIRNIIIGVVCGVVTGLGTGIGVSLALRS